MPKETVATDKAPAAIGPYSQAVKFGNMVFTSGQIPLDPATGKLVEGDITVQAEQVLTNLSALLTESGSSIDKVIKTTCFLTNLDDFQTFNEIYARYFGEGQPARSTVQVSRLPAGAIVEVECIAELG
jgi:2-iminobutanoate/2-iminopropanoate deaminase